MSNINKLIFLNQSYAFSSTHLGINYLRKHEIAKRNSSNSRKSSITNPLIHSEFYQNIYKRNFSTYLTKVQVAWNKYFSYPVH